MDGLQVRPFRRTDFSACVALYMDTFSQPPWRETWDSSEVVKSFLLKHMDNNYFTAYVAVDEDKLVGASIGFKKPWMRGFEYYIDEFFISPDYQGQGIGRQFMEAIKADLLKQDIHAIILLTERDYPAFKFYRDIGFNADAGLTFLDITF